MKNRLKLRNRSASQPLPAKISSVTALSSDACDSDKREDLRRVHCKVSAGSVGFTVDSLLESHDSHLQDANVPTVCRPRRVRIY